MNPICAHECDANDHEVNNTETFEDVLLFDDNDILEATSSVTIDQSANSSVTAPKMTRNPSRFWYYDQVDDDSECLPGEIVTSGKRSRVPSRKFQQFLSGEAITGAHLDIEAEIDSEIPDEDLRFMHYEWPNYVDPTTSARDIVVSRLQRCKQIVKHIKLHKEPFDEIRKKLASRADWEYHEALAEYKQAFAL
jgi:hypothetical protein